MYIAYKIMKSVKLDTLLTNTYKVSIGKLNV